MHIGLCAACCAALVEPAAAIRRRAARGRLRRPAARYTAAECSRLTGSPACPMRYLSMHVTLYGVREERQSLAES